jgi:hypothetical protein
MDTQITPAETLKLTEALSSLYGTVLLAAQKRRARFTRARAARRDGGESGHMEQLELDIAVEGRHT